MSKPRVAIIFELAASYKADFYSRLLRYPNAHFHIFCQAAIPGINLHLSHLDLYQKFPKQVTIVNSISIKNGFLNWQYLPFINLFRRFDIFIMTGNPRDVSNILFAFFAKVFRKKVIIWNLAHSHRNRMVTESIRIFMWKFFDVFLLYTPGCVEFLKTKGFNKKMLISINNGLDQNTISEVSNALTIDALQSWRISKNIVSRNIIISCGRLNRKDTYDLVINGFQKLISQIPDILWCIIGDGNRRFEFENLSRRLGLEHHIWFVGESYDECQLAPWFKASKLFIHPAPIGLSVLHAFGYGLPVITHDNVKEHGPEIFYLKDDFNGVMYNKNDISCLYSSVIALLEDNNKIAALSANALATANLYNTHEMFKKTIELVNTLHLG